MEKVESSKKEFSKSLSRAAQAYRKRDFVRFKALLKRADAIAMRLRNAGGHNTSRFCGEIAGAFFRIRDYARGRQWLNRVYQSKDKDIKVLERFLTSRDDGVVIAAIRAAAGSGSEAVAVKVALQAAESKNLSVRLASFRTVARIGSVKAAQDLYKRFQLRKQAYPVKEEAALYRMVGAVKNAVSPTELYSRYRRVARERKGQSVEVLRLAIAEALIISGARGVNRFLGQIWRSQVSMRLPLARLLARGSAADVRPFIRSVLPGSGQDLFVALMRGWARAGVQHRYLELYMRAVNRFEGMGISPAPLLEGMMGIPAAALRPVLKRYLNKEKLDFNTAVALQRLLIKGRDTGLISDLLGSMKRKNEDIQYLSVMVGVLGELGSKEAVPLLERYLKHDAPGLRLLSAQSLKKITGKTYTYQGFGD